MRCLCDLCHNMLVGSYHAICTNGSTGDLQNPLLKHNCLLSLSVSDKPVHCFHAVNLLVSSSESDDQIVLDFVCVKFN